MENVSPAGMTDRDDICEALRVHLGREPRDGGRASARAHLSYLPEELARSTAFRIWRCRASSTRCSRTTTVGLATGNLRDGARLKLEHAGVGPLRVRQRRRLTSADAGTHRRDAPRGPPLRLRPSSSATLRDVAAAHAASFVAIGVATSSQRRLVADAGADRMIERSKLCGETSTWLARDRQQQRASGRVRPFRASGACLFDGLALAF